MFLRMRLNFFVTNSDELVSIGKEQTNRWKYAFQEGLAPINLVVENEFHRAAPGGTGGVKTIGNYASVSELVTSVEQASLITALAFRLIGSYCAQGLYLL